MPPQRPDGARGPAMSPRGHLKPKRPATPPRQTPVAGDWPRPHGSQRGARGPATTPLQPDGTQGTGNTYTPAGRSPGTGPAPTSARRGLRHRPRRHGSQTQPRGPAKPPRQPEWAQGIGHAPTVATQGRGDWHAPTVPRGPNATNHTPTAARRGPGDQPHPHSGQTGPRGRAMYPWHPDRAQGTGHDNTTATRGPAKFYVDQTGPRGPATPPQRPDGTKGSGHAPNASQTGAEDWPSPHGGNPGLR